MSVISKSAVVTSPKEVEIRDFELDSIAPDHALLRVELTGVCGTDPKIYNGKFNKEALPSILGHEVVGRIERIGPEAETAFGVDAGDRVVLEPTRHCGDCDHCLQGRYQYCERVTSYGFTSTTEAPGMWGGHAEYLYLTPGTIVLPIDDDLPAEAGVIAAAVVGNSVAWLQAGNEDILGKSLVIQGPGPQGLSMGKVAKHLGYNPVVVTGVPGDEDRLHLAREMGADETVCSPPDELVERTIERLGEHPDAVVNVTGSARTIQDSIDLVGVEGTVIYPNMVGGEPSNDVDFDQLVLKGARIQGVFTSTAEHIEPAIELIEQDPDPFAKMVTHKFSIEDAEQAYRAVGGEGGDPTQIKSVIDPGL